MPTEVMAPVDPDALLDYKFDWAPKTNGVAGSKSDWLESGDTVDTFVITANGVSIADGLTVVDTLTPAAPSKTDTNTSVTVWFYNATQGATIACKIRTVGKRIDERTLEIGVEER